MKPSEKDLEEAREFVDDWGVYDGPDTAERVAPTFARLRTEGYRACREDALVIAMKVVDDLNNTGTDGYEDTRDGAAAVLAHLRALLKGGDDAE